MISDVLSEADRYYLVENLWIEVEGGPSDPQMQRVYGVESNIIELESPIWTRSEVVDAVASIGSDFGLKMDVEWIVSFHSFAVEWPDRWVVELPFDRSCPLCRPLNTGEYLASIVLHECAHAITLTVARNSAEYNTAAFQSHGPEFVQCFLDLLARVMDTKKARAAFEFMGVKIGSDSAEYGSSAPPGAEHVAGETEDHR